MKGKAKIDFEQWFKNNPQCIKLAYVILRDITHNELVECFYQLPETMQQGVIREFFESKGIWVVVKPQFEVGLPLSCEFYYKVYSGNKPHSIESGLWPDYSTAFTHAIDKACEVYNNNDGGVK